MPKSGTRQYYSLESMPCFLSERYFIAKLHIELMSSSSGRPPRESDETILSVLRSTADPVLSTAEIAEQLTIKRRSTLNRLRDLETKELVESKQIGGRNTVWWLSAKGEKAHTISEGDILVRRKRRSFLQGKPHVEGGFRTGTPQASSVRDSDSACGVLWQCHNCTRPVASHRLLVSKAGSLPTGQGGQRC